MLDYNFGNISQEIAATISHSAEGADFNSSAFMNRTSTFQSSTLPQSANQERHWDVNSTADTNVRYASSNTVQNENFDYFNSSKGVFFPATQNFENSDYTYGAENPAMAFSTASSTTTLNPFEQTCPNNSAWLQPDPNLSFYNQLPANSQGLEDPPNYLTICDPTNKYCNVPINMQSRQSAVQNCEMQCFQDKDYDAVAIARKSDRTTKTTSWASDLNSTSINVQYPGNPYAEKPNHMATLQPVSTRTNTVMKEKFHNEFLNIQNSACRNIENSHSYTNPDFDQGLLGSQLDVNEISHYSYKSQGQFDDKNRFQNIFQCHFCGSYQIILNGQELPLNSSSVPFKCNVCIELMKLKEKIEPRVKIAKVCHERSANKLQKKMKVLDKRFSCNACNNTFTSQKDLERHILTHTGVRPFSCDICHKKFSQRGNLKQHILTHTGEKPYPCEICGKTFSLKSTLKKHTLTHTGEKPFSCEIWHKMFSRKGSKHIHILTHSENKRFQCDVCGNSFKCNKYLLKHKRKHQAHN